MNSASMTRPVASTVFEAPSTWTSGNSRCRDNARVTSTQSLPQQPTNSYLKVIDPALHSSLDLTMLSIAMVLFRNLLLRNVTTRRNHSRPPTTSKRSDPSIHAYPSAVYTPNSMDMLYQIRGGGERAITNHRGRLASLSVPATLRPNKRLNDAFETLKQQVTDRLQNLKTSVSPPPTVYEPVGPLQGLSKFWFGSVPQVVRYFVAANMANVMFYVLDLYISQLLEEHHATIFGISKATLEEAQEAITGDSSWLPSHWHVHADSISFFVAYIVQVIPQHFLYAVLVYGWKTIATPKQYISTLLGTYSAVMMGMMGSTILNGYLLNNPYHKLEKTTAFVTTLCIFSIINYVVITWIVQKTSSATAQRPEEITLTAKVNTRQSR